MATTNKKNVKNLPSPGFGGVPFGNVSCLPFQFAVNASGYMVDSDKPAIAVANGEVVRLGVLPAGMTLLDMITCISDAFAASTTGTLGFQYVDGVDSAVVPQDDDFFMAATTTAATAVLRKTNVTPPVTLPKDAYLILTCAGAAQSAAGIMDINILGVLNGAP